MAANSAVWPNFELIRDYIYFFLLPARMEKIKSETRIFRGSNYCLAIALSEDKDIQGITVFEKLMVHNDPDIDLVSDNEYTRFG